MFALVDAGSGSIPSSSFDRMRGMFKMLVLCSRDWLHPKAGPVERYVYEVFSRMAAQGHRVMWVSHHYPVFALADKGAQRVETVDGIHIARLGFRAFYRKMVNMLILRMLMSKKLDYDIVVDCVTRRPLSLDAVTHIPIVPLVFDLHRRVRASEDPPGPVIATSTAARRRLCDAGLPESFIVRAPFAVDPKVHELVRALDGAVAGKDLVAIGGTSGLLSKALKDLRLASGSPNVDLVERALLRPRAPWPLEDRVARYAGARVGYCGPGFEQEALVLAACGVPVVCPATTAGEEYVEHEKTGLLFRPGDPCGLAEGIRRLLNDDALRQRLADEARTRARARTWNTTASLVLATFEIL